MNAADDSWLTPDPPSYQSFYLLLFAVVTLIAAILILTGAPIQDPLSFLTVLVFVFGFGLICSLLHREVSRGLGFKDPDYDMPI